VLNGTAAGGSDQWNMTYPRKAGDKVIYNFNTLDYEGANGGQVRYGITEDGARADSSLDNWKQFTLVSAPAGIAPAPEPEPAADGPAAGGGSEAPQQPVVIADPVAPKTGDPLTPLVFALVICAVCSFMAVKRASIKR
jgi:hypothetical protein